MPTKRKAARREEVKLESDPPQKRSRARTKEQPASNESHSQDQEHSDDDQEPTTQKSVLGGLKGGYRLTGEPDESMTSEQGQTTTFNIPYGDDKFIVCERRLSTGKQSTTKSQKTTSSSQPSPASSLIFTHGAGGGIANPATACFMQGFNSVSSAVCFQGAMDLKSRVKTFHAVIEHESFLDEDETQNKTSGGGSCGKALGGRSMGARAAVMALLQDASDAKLSSRKPPALILVSYPLVGGGGKKNQGAKDIRDAILLELDENVDVLFISGSEDSMCDLGMLQDVRRNMKAQTWVLEVVGADHGMSLKATKSAVEKVRIETGRLAAEWLRQRGRDRDLRHRLVSGDADADNVVVGKWKKEGELNKEEGATNKNKQKQPET